MDTRRRLRELLGLLAFAAMASGCDLHPSGTSQQSTSSVTLSGVSRQPNQVFDFYLRDRRGAEVGVAPAETALSLSATTASSEFVTGDGLYALSVTIPTSALPASAWISQVSDGRMQGGLPRSVGRVEIVGKPRGGGQPYLRTFTPAALSCLKATADPNAALACTDGDSFLVYDNDGVGLDEAPGTAADFVQIAGSPFALSGAASGIDLEIGTYEVPGLASPVNAVVCHPHDSVPSPGRRTVVLNHGVYALDAGALDACVNGARAGWLAALTAYRFEAITAVVPPPPPLFPPALYLYPSAIERPGTGDPSELCLGEVTDALRWLDIVRTRPDTDDDQMLMWGYSHGACVTLRSLEQGAKVKAAVAVSAPTEFFMWESFATATNPTGAAGIHTLLGGTPAALPDAYRARSAARMAVDLERRSDVRLLTIAVQKDTLVHPSQGCRMANAIGAENHQMLAGGEYSLSADSPLGVDFAGCITGYLNWTGGAPASWNKRAMFLLYANITPIDGHAFFGYTTPPPVGGSWVTPLNKGIRDFIQASFP